MVHHLQGRFIELQFRKITNYQEENLCMANFGTKATTQNQPYESDESLIDLYSIVKGENMCPRDYELNVDTQSWGACICWENGGRRSKNGTSSKCMNIIPAVIPKNDGTMESENITDERACTSTMRPNNLLVTNNQGDRFSSYCTKEPSPSNQICPLNATVDPDNGACIVDGSELTILPKGLD